MRQNICSSAAFLPTSLWLACCVCALAIPRPAHYRGLVADTDARLHSPPRWFVSLTGCRVHADRKALRMLAAFGSAEVSYTHNDLR